MNKLLEQLSKIDGKIRVILMGDKLTSRRRKSLDSLKRRRAIKVAKIRRLRDLEVAKDG